MTKEEFARLAMLIKTSYSSQKLFQTEETYEVWYRMLSDLDYHMVDVFLVKWISTEPYAPKISDIRHGCSSLITEELAPWEDEWKKVVNAIGSCGREGEERAMKKFNPVTQKVVSALGWRSICNEPEENTMSLRANFRDCYNRYAERQMQDSMLPATVRKMIEDFKPRELFLEDGT